MARSDSLKEEIGWLKVVFAALIAIDASLIGWLAQNYGRYGWSLVLGGFAGAIVFTYAIAHVNRLAYDRIRKLKRGA